MATKLTRESVVNDLSKTKRKSKIRRVVMGGFFCLASIIMAILFLGTTLGYGIFLIPAFMGCMGIIVIFRKDTEENQIDRDWECVLATLKEDRTEQRESGSDRFFERYLDFECDGEIYTFRFSGKKITREDREIVVGNTYYIIISQPNKTLSPNQVRLFGNVLKYYAEKEHFLELYDGIVNRATPKEKRPLSKMFGYFFVAVFLTIAILEQFA